MRRFVFVVALVLILFGLVVKKALTPPAFEKEANGQVILGSDVPVLPLARFVNFVMEPFKRLVLPMDEATIRKLALAKGVNLSNFVGSEIMDLGLFRHQLADCDANANFIGRLHCRDQFAVGLAVQWRLSQIIQSHPEVLEEQIVAPLVLTGLPRSSSTYLHQVLGDLGLGLRFPTFWESGCGPVPLEALAPEDVGSERDPRMVQAKRTLDMIKTSPTAAVLHEFHGLMEPEEETGWLQHSFALLRWESYALFLRSMQGDARLKYRFFKRLLQVAQWEHWVRTGERPRWLLKTPDHLMSLNELVEFFPDVRLVAISRDATPAMKSLVVLNHHINSVLRTPLVEDALLFSKGYICMGLEGLNMLSTLRVNKTFVTFEQATRDTKATVERIVRFAGLEWGRNEETRLEVVMKRRKDLHSQKPRFTYNMNDFGLNATAIRELLARCPEELRGMRARSHMP